MKNKTEFMKRRAKRLAEHKKKRAENKRIERRLGANSDALKERKDNIATRAHNKEVQAKYKALTRKEKENKIKNAS